MIETDTVFPQIMFSLFVVYSEYLNFTMSMVYNVNLKTARENTNLKEFAMHPSLKVDLSSPYLVTLP